MNKIAASENSVQGWVLNRGLALQEVACSKNVVWHRIIQNTNTV